MKHPRQRAGPRFFPARGFSLIELMVALAIGLVIAAASFSAFLGASGASKVAEAQARMNEDAQATLGILTQQLRMAGSNPNQPGRVDAASRRDPLYGPAVYPTGAYTMSNFTLRGCDGKFAPPASSAPDRLDDLICDSQPAQPESLALSYEADRFNTVPTAADGLPSDCLGNKLGTITAALPTLDPAALQSATYAVAVNRFYIAVSSAQVPSLYCKGSGLNTDGTASSAKPLVENIEDMQFSFGAVPASTAAADVAAADVAGYLTAAEVLSQANMAGLASDAERWAKVVAVRICILARSEAAVAANAASARYLKCDGTLESSPPDLRLRRAYTTTVVVRNRRFHHD
ncbi:MAG: PilW family protein [Polaromonas sp.]|nr:PilW family protein [Polaromonas sp.]